MGVASQKQGLLPINQHAMHFMGKIAYTTSAASSSTCAQRAPLIRDLGDKKIALLRNHGSLVCGPTIGAAMVAHYQLEIACQGQIAALAGGSEVVLDRPGGSAVCAGAGQDQQRRQGRRRQGLEGPAAAGERLFPTIATDAFSVDSLPRAASATRTFGGEIRRNSRPRTRKNVERRCRECPRGSHEAARVSFRAGVIVCAMCVAVLLCPRTSSPESRLR